MEPMTIAAGASVVSGLLGFKGNQAAARTAQQTADYNAALAENEAVLLARATTEREAAVRRASDSLASSQITAISKSGVEITGSPLLALANTYFNTEEDAMRIRFAGDIEQMNKESEAALARAEGRARAAGFRLAAMNSLVGAASGVAGAYQQQSLLGLQKDFYSQKIEA
mgnify:FL=1